MTIQIAAIIFTLSWLFIGMYYFFSDDWFGTEDSLVFRAVGSLIWGWATCLGIIVFGGVILVLITLCLGAA